MIALAALLAGLAVVLSVPTGSGRSSLRRLTLPARSSRRHRTGTARRRWITGGSVALVVAAAGAAYGVGPAAGVVLLVGGATAGVVTWLVVGARDRRAEERRRRSVAQACAAVAAQVRVGRVPTDALSSAALDHPVLAVPARTLLMGGDVASSLRAEATRAGCGGLADLGQAWQFALTTGAPMAGVLDQVAVALRDDEAIQRTVAAELAGPRASGTVMAVLPLLGVGLGYVIGGDPISFLVEGPVGWACLTAGTALALVGVCWMSHLARTPDESGDGNR